MTAALAPSLVRRVRPPEPEPVWDAGAQRVLSHEAGPLRIVGGPGTGKTTLLLTAVARRLAAGEDPARTLVLVGSRRAAAELRERLVRLGAGDGATSREALVRTVHSYAFGVLRLHAARHGDPPPRLLASAEQDALVRDLLGGEVEGVVPGIGLAGADRACAGGAGLRRRAPRAAAARRRAGARSGRAGRGGGPARGCRVGRGGAVLPLLRAGHAAAGRGGAGSAAGHGARARRGRAGGGRARRARGRSRAARRRARAGAPPRRRRRARPRPAADGAGGRARAQRGHRAAGGRSRSGRPDLPRRRSGRHAGHPGGDGGAHRRPSRDARGARGRCGDRGPVGRGGGGAAASRSARLGARGGFGRHWPSTRARPGARRGCARGLRWATSRRSCRRGARGACACGCQQAMVGHLSVPARSARRVHLRQAIGDHRPARRAQGRKRTLRSRR